VDRKLIAQFQREQLHTAAQDGDLECVEELLRAKYPVNRFDELGKTALHYAADEGHLEVVDCLLEAGADVNAHDERVVGNTPLRECVDSCAPEVVERLLRAGADPMIRGWMQMSAIDQAAGRKDANAKKIQRLLQQAANARRPATGKRG
jgi:ankyrin repeat protein